MNNRIFRVSFLINEPQDDSMNSEEIKEMIQVHLNTTLDSNELGTMIVEEIGAAPKS